MKSARLIVTLDCVRSCPYCCNEYQSMKNIMKQVTLSDVVESTEYDEIVITGGEPMLKPKVTEAIIKLCKAANPRRPVFIYTTWYKSLADLLSMIELVDGMTYSIHNPFINDDVERFKTLQNLTNAYRDKSFRLFINQQVWNEIPLRTNKWDNIKIMGPISEADLVLPKHEDLLILKRAILPLLI